MTHPRIRVAVLALALVGLFVGGIALAAADTDTSTTGNYTLSELRDGGTIVDTRFPSVRKVSSTSALWLKRYDPSLFSSYGDGGTYLESHHTVERNRLRLYSSSPFDGEPEMYRLEVVYWQPVEKTEVVNGTTTTSREARIIGSDTLYYDISPGFQQFVDVSLTPHYDRTVHVTIFAYKNGAQVAKWADFQHRSLPSTAPVDINSKGDIWTYVLTNVHLYGLGAIIAGFAGARWTLSRTGTGPRIGVIPWIILVAVIAAVLGSGAYYQITVILAYFPQLLGLLLGVIVYAGALRMHDPVQTIAFWRPKIEDTAPLRRDDLEATKQDVIGDGGDTTEDGRIGPSEYKDARVSDFVQLPFITTSSGETRIPKSGLRPWLARIWADPASPDKSDIQTPQYVDSGKLDEIITVDPTFDPTVIHEAATLTWDPPLTSGDIADAESLLETVQRVNWGFILGAIALLVGGYTIGQSMRLPILGAGVGALGVVVMCVKARDGVLEFTPAPEHFRAALASNTILQREYKDAKSLEAALEDAAEERTRTAMEAREHRVREDMSITRELANESAPGIDDFDDQEEDDGDE